MAIPYVDKYKEGIFSFPSDDIAFDSKNEKWHQEYAKAILRDYATDNCGIAYSERDRIILNRRYAEGTNSEDLFKDIVYEFQRDEAERQAYVQIDFTIIPIIAKFKSVFIGILSTIQHRIAADSIDSTSMTKKAIKKAKLWLKKAYSELLGEIDTKLGIEQKETEYIPESREELDMYQQIGGIKLGIETAIEAGMSHCFFTSRWDEEIMPQILGDYFDNGMAACRDYFDNHTYTVKQEYIDIANMIVQYSKSPSFENARYKGYFKNYTIADVRVITGWSEDKILEIARKYDGEYGNTKILNWGGTLPGDTKGPYTDSVSHYSYDPMVIPAAVLEFESTMYEYDVEKTDQGGNKSFYKTDRDRKYNLPNRKSYKTAIKVWHKVSIIPATEDVFDWGLQHDIPRPKFDDARSSFHFYRINGKSLCERAIPHAKQIQLTYLKIQNLISMSSPSGIAVEWNALKGMTFNKKEVEPLEILKIRRQTGDILYKTTTARGYINNSGGIPPIKDVKGTYTLADYIAMIEHHITQIRELTGINDQGGRGEDTATGARLSFMTTDIALKQVYNAYIAIIKDTAINAAARLRDLLAYSETAREIYGSIIGMNKVELLDLVEDLPTANIAIKIEVRISNEKRAKVEEAAIAAMKPGKEGVPVLRFSDYFLIMRMLDSGNEKWAQAIIAQKESQIEKMAIVRSTQAKKMDEEMGINIARVKEDEMRKTKQFETEEEIRKYKAEKDKDDELAENQHKRNMELERLKLSEKQLQPAE